MGSRGREGRNGSPPGHDILVAGFLGRFRSWAPGCPRLRAAALVGSWARGCPRADSDVDIVVITDAAEALTDDDGWARPLGVSATIGLRQWGVLTERRMRLPGDVVVDLGVVGPQWAATSPVDPGTRRVVTDGCEVLYDPTGMLTALIRACRP